MLKKIAGILLFIFIFAIITFGTIKKYAPVKKIPTSETRFEETKEHRETDSILSDDTTSEMNYYVKLGKREFEVLSAHISKECSFSDMPVFDKDTVLFENGSLTSAHSFLYLTLKLINNTDEEEEASINNCPVAAWQGEEKSNNIYPYMLAGKTGVQGVTYFHVMVAPHTEETVEILYIIEDTYLDESYDLKLCIDPSGHEGLVLNMKTSEETEIPYDWSKDVAYIILNELMKEGIQ